MCRAFGPATVKSDHCFVYASAAHNVNDHSDYSNVSPHGLTAQYRMPLVVAAHGMLFSFALLAAFLLAYNFRWVVGRDEQAYRLFFELYVPLLVLATPIKLLAFLWTGQYRGSWRYVGLRDLMGVIRASLVGSFFFLSAYFILENLWQMQFGQRLIDQAPNGHLQQSTVFALDWASTVVFVSAARIVVRFYYEDIQPGRTTNPNRAFPPKCSLENLVVSTVVTTTCFP